MDKVPELTKTTYWRGVYRDIAFQIQRFDSMKSLDPDKEWSWTHYIFLWVSQLPVEVQESAIPRVYYTQFGTRLEVEPKDSFAHKIEFHGGCTYYQVEHKNEYDTLLKIGCDYQHLWDQHKEYTVEYVRSEVVATIDSLWNYFPTLKKYEDINEKFRAKFPGKNNPEDHRHFNHLGEPIDFEY